MYARDVYEYGCARAAFRAETRAPSGDDGVATPTQISELRYAEGTAAQDLYVAMMTKHHRGAVAAAHEEIAHGQMNRPGSDGGSGYWISTRAWSLRWAA